jgi:hypothetical protein
MVNKFTTIKERVVLIAKKQSISQERFFHSIGMTSANFRGKAKETPLNSNALANIITKYPEVDLHWLLLGESKSSKENILNEQGLSYETTNKSCKEKDEIIAMLKGQIDDLKADKEDLRELLKLARKK